MAGMGVQPASIFCQAFDCYDLKLKRWPTDGYCHMHSNSVRLAIGCLVLGWVAICPPSNLNATAEETKPLPMTSGWSLKPPFVTDKGFKLYRKHSVLNGSIPNLMIYNCSPNPASHYSYLTFILPNGFEPSSFERQASKPGLKARVMVDERNAFAIDTEYRSGEIYIDDSPANKSAFHAMLTGNDISLAFGEKNDVVRFHMNEKVDELLSKLAASKMITPPMTHMSRSEGITDCETFGKHR